MRNQLEWAIVVSGLSYCLVSCGGAAPPVETVETAAQRQDRLEERLVELANDGGLTLDPELAAAYERAAGPIAALQRGEFERAERLATQQLAAREGADADNPYLHLVAGASDVAIAFIPLWKHYNEFEIYFEALELALKLPREMRPQIARMAAEHATGEGSDSFEEINWVQLAESMARIRRGFAAADEHLARAEEAEGIQLLLCPECWHVDWNDDGVVDREDDIWRLSFDEDGVPIPEEAVEGSASVYRFDRGDIVWLRAMISFQSAAADLVRAYDWSDLPDLIHGSERVTLRLVDADLVRSARERIRAGLAHSGRSRTMYLAEDDDYLEFLASPDQESHPFPDQLSEAGFEAWPTALGELETIIGGDANVPIDALVYILSETAWESGAEQKAVALGAFFDQPSDIVLDLALVENLFESRRIDDLNAFLGIAVPERVVDAGPELGIFRLWTDSIEDLDRDRPNNREASSRYLVRRRVLFVN